MVLLILISEILMLFPPLLYAKVIDSIIAKDILQKSLILAGVAFGFTLLNNILIKHIAGHIELNRIDYDVERYISNQSIKKILSFSAGQSASENMGTKQSIASRGERALIQFTEAALYQTIPLFLQVSVAVIAMFIMNLFLGAVVLFGVLMYSSISLYLNNKFKNSVKRLDDLYNEKNKEQLEILGNMDIIKINAQEDTTLKRFDGKILKLCNLGKKVWKRYANLAVIRGSIADITELAVMAMGIVLVYQGLYTPGTLVIFWSWSSRAFSDLGQIGSLQRMYMQESESIKKYFSLLNTESDIKERKHSVKLKKLKGEIEFRNVYFKYPYRKKLSEEEEAELHENLDIIVEPPKEEEEAQKNKFALEDASFKIKHGQKVAFVGHSGAGKSTIIQLLLRSYDVSKGKILIDGVNIKYLNLKTYRRKLGVVPQDVGIFDRSLEDNITFGIEGFGEKVTDEKLREISRLACIDQFINRLEHGFKTIIGEKGIRLSGGERQRVGIARALIKDPAILIFDEATSNLDTENEKLIHAAIDKVTKGRTSVIIAHRLSTIKNADKIFVMDKGRIASCGTHEELMKKCDIYRSLVINQRLK